MSARWLASHVGIAVDRSRTEPHAHRRGLPSTAVVDVALLWLPPVMEEVFVHRKPPAPGSWLGRMLMRKPKMLVAIALANKMARTIWAMLTKREDYRE